MKQQLTEKQKAIARDQLSSRIDVVIADDVTDEPNILKSIGQYAMGVYDFTQDTKEVLGDISDEERRNLYQDIQVRGYGYNAIKEKMED